MRSFLHLAIGFFLVFLIISCNVPTNFSSQDEDVENVTIKTIEEGAFLSTEEQVSISLEYDNELTVLHGMAIELLSPEGEVLGTQRLGYIDLQEETLPKITLPPLETGYYTLRITTFGEDEEIKAEKEVGFFYLGGVFTIRNIYSFPPIIKPQTEALISAQLETPQDADPYVRWSMDGYVLSEGPVSKGYDKLNWNAPEEEGVYTVTLELFPLAPPEGSYSFPSELMMDAEVFVSDRKTRQEGDLYPNSNYYSVIHFQGDYRDEGSREDIGDVELIGTSHVDVRGNLFGYYLDGTSGFLIDDIVLPSDEKQRSLLPFSISFLLNLDVLPNEKRFFSTGDNETFEFSVSSDEKGRLYSTILLPSEEVRSQSDITMQPDSNHSITLSVVPGKDRIAFYWFHNGEPVSHEVKEFETVSVPEEGTTIIGGDGGFKGLIYVFGVFYRDERVRSTIDSQVYLRSVRGLYGEGVLFADGFDGLFLQKENYEIVGEASVANGSLSLSPGGSLSLPGFSIGLEQIFVEMDFTTSNMTEDQYIEVEFSDEILRPIVISGDGIIHYEGNVVHQITQDENIYEVVFIHDQYGFAVLFNSIELVKITEVDDYSDVTVTMVNGNDKEALLLDRVLVRGESLQVISSNRDESETDTEKITTFDEAIPAADPTEGNSITTDDALIRS